MLEFDRTVSPKDHMKTASEEAYFRTALSAHDGIARAVATANRKPESILKILDFGSGYGRVLRVLKAAYPNATLTACDLMPDAINFCAEQFGAVPLLGNSDLDLIEDDGTYDLIWLGSVFTHLPVSGWRSLLTFLERRLAPDGIIVFTSHGRVAMWVFENHTLDKHKGRISRGQFEDVKRKYKDDGFAFLSYDNKQVSSLSRIGIEVAESTYGLAFARPDWTLGLLAKEFRHLFLLSYVEGGWDNNHDMVAVNMPKLQRDV
jgi:SAM-dependent methyltransferase